ncbi:MAG: UPF0489 family protein [Bacteroidetes bacterium]|nr:UPF0489 family protein [Bacteroidota bacterium]MBU1578489.1 UPF0489 family protein [Bacteroidota bacterium]MBU2557037.1 UPF0489 family protein [Bacteroidota bacterium]
MKNIIEFKGQNTSWVRDLNLLCKKNNIYVMDNHVAGLWCWLQEIKTNEKYNILHIDAHYDTMASRIDTWVEHIPDNIKELSIHEYLAIKFYDEDFRGGHEIMRWDNYFPIFHRMYKENVNSYHFFTHGEGSLFDEMKDKLNQYPIYGLLNLIDYLFDKGTSGPYKWIVNIDLDYFFQKIDDTEITIRFISNDAIDFLIHKLKAYLSSGKIEVMTIALSPECCGGWKNSIDLMNYFAIRLNLKIDAIS